MRELKYVNTKPSILLVRTKADAQMKYSRETTSRSDAEIAAHIRNMNSTTLGGWVLQKFKTKIVSAMALWEAVSGEKSSSRGESIYQFDEQSLLEELKIPTQCRPELKRESFELYESWMRSCGGAPPPSTGLDLLKRQPFQFYESNVRSCRGSPPP
jgi:hypothetical protein